MFPFWKNSVSAEPRGAKSPPRPTEAHASRIGNFGCKERPLETKQPSARSRSSPSVAGTNIRAPPMVVTVPAARPAKPPLAEEVAGNFFYCPGPVRRSSGPCALCARRRRPRFPWIAVSLLAPPTPAKLCRVGVAKIRSPPRIAEPLGGPVPGARTSPINPPWPPRPAVPRCLPAPPPGSRGWDSPA